MTVVQQLYSCKTATGRMGTQRRTSSKHRMQTAERPFGTFRTGPLTPLPELDAHVPLASSHRVRPKISTHPLPCALLRFQVAHKLIPWSTSSAPSIRTTAASGWSRVGDIIFEVSQQLAPLSFVVLLTYILRKDKQARKTCSSICSVSYLG